MLINKDRENEHAVRVAFTEQEGKDNGFFSGRVDRITFGADEYEWHANGAAGYAEPDGPVARSTMTGGAETLYPLPKASITILRGTIGRR
jgi:hypothetical protein